MDNRQVALPDLIMRECGKRCIDRYLLFGAALQAILEGALLPSPNPPEPYPNHESMAAHFSFRWLTLVQDTAAFVGSGGQFPNWAPWHRAIMIDEGAFMKWAAQRFDRKVKSRPSQAKIDEFVSNIFTASESKRETVPTEAKILALVKIDYPNVARRQVRDAMTKLQRGTKRGRPKKIAAVI